jgi:hypothetical protein
MESAGLSLPLWNQTNALDIASLLFSHRPGVVACDDETPKGGRLRQVRALFSNATFEQDFGVWASKWARDAEAKA